MLAVAGRGVRAAAALARFSFLLACRPGAEDLAGALAADLVAAFPAAAVGPAAVAPRGAGNGFHAGRPRGRRSRDPRGGETHQRPDRLRTRAFVVGLRACADSVGERARAVHPVAAHSFHAMERAADFFAPARGLYHRWPCLL